MLGGQSGLRVRRDDDIHLERDQLRRKGGEPLEWIQSPETF